MATKGPASVPPLMLVCGEDDYAVKQRAKAIYSTWCSEIGGMDHEIVDATVTNSSDALKAISKLRMALQTLPFFGTGKAVWFQNCNFLGDERAASTKDVTETLAVLGGELKAFKFGGVRLLISASKVDKRKSFYKTLEKTGGVEIHDGLSGEDRDWQIKAESLIENQIAEAGKSITRDAVATIIASVGPNSRLLANETSKLLLYVGDRSSINLTDVDSIVSKNKTAKAFALGDALGERNLPKLLKNLDEELWAMKVDSKKSEIALLYGVITKIRNMLLAKELMREGYLSPTHSTQALQAQVMKIPQDKLPKDRNYNPASLHPFVLSRAMEHSKNYTLPELVQAMDLLLQCNRNLVSTGADETLMIQRTLISIVSKPESSQTRSRR